MRVLATGPAAIPPSRRSTSGGSSSATCPSGRRCATSPSATRTTGSPSTGTSSRPRPTPPPWPTGSTAPTCCCSGPCSTTSARASPATTPRSAWWWRPTSPPGWASPPEDVATIVTMVRLHLLLPDTATRRDLDDPATAREVADEVGDRAHPRAAGRHGRGRQPGHRPLGLGRAGRPGSWPTWSSGPADCSTASRGRATPGAWLTDTHRD